MENTEKNDVLNLSRIKGIFQKQLAVKNFTIYVLGKLIALLFSFLLLPLFTHKLPKEEFGIIGLLWLIIPLSRRIIDLGSDVSVSLKFFKLDKKELSNWLYHTITIILFNLLLWGGIISILPPNVFNLSFTGLVLVLLIATSQSINSLWASFSKLEGNAKRYIFITNLPPILTALFTTFLIYKIKANYMSYLWGMVAGHGIITLYALVNIRNSYSLKFFHPQKKIYKNILKIGIPVIPGTMSTIILAYGDRFVIENLIGLSYVAVYTLGYRMAEFFLITFLQPFQNTVMPKIMRLAQENLNKALDYLESLLLRVGVAIILFLVVILVPMKSLIFLIGGQEYYSGYSIFLLVLVGIFVSNVTTISGILFNHFEKTQLNMILNTLVAGINIGMNYLLIPYMGIDGACLATIIAYVIQQPLIIILTNHFLPRNIKISKIFVIQLIGIVYILFLYFLESGNINNNLIEYGAKIFASGIVFLILIIYFPNLKTNILKEIK